MAKRKRPNEDGRDKLFAFVSPLDVLLKLRWEHVQFFRALHPPEALDEARYHALNACVTAYQLCDWVAFFIEKEIGWEVAAQRLGASPLAHKGHLQEWFWRQGPLVACQQIALAYKHVDIDAVAYRAEVRTQEGKISEPVRGRAYEFVVTTEHGEWDLVHVVSIACLVWEEVLEKLQLAAFVSPPKRA